MNYNTKNYILQADPEEPSMLCISVQYLTLVQVPVEGKRGAVEEHLKLAGP
jgi:hypothetical protein